LGNLKQTKNLTIFLVVVMVVALTYLMMDYTHQQKRQAAFTLQIDSATHSLAILPAPASDLEQKLAAAGAANAAALQAVSSDSLNSTDIINALLINADHCGLRVTPVTTESWVTKKVGSGRYNILPLKFQAQGSLDNLTEFIQAIANPDLYPYLVIEGIEIVNPVAETNIAASYDSPITANLALDIIARLPQVQEAEN
jgi:hypothetical protein